MRAPTQRCALRAKDAQRRAPDVACSAPKSAEQRDAQRCVIDCPSFSSSRDYAITVFFSSASAAAFSTRDFIATLMAPLLMPAAFRVERAIFTDIDTLRHTTTNPPCPRPVTITRRFGALPCARAICARPRCARYGAYCRYPPDAALPLIFLFRHDAADAIRWPRSLAIFHHCHADAAPPPR